MITERKLTLKPIFESSGGIHVSIYIQFEGDILSFRSQLSQNLKEVEKQLSLALQPNEIKKFIAPFHELLFDQKIIKEIKGHVGIFRNEQLFRIVSIPTALSSNSFVATSFHIKPLLKMLQQDRDFLVLGLEQNFAVLFWGNRKSVQKLDTLYYSKLNSERNHFPQLLNLKALLKAKSNSYEIASWVNGYLYEHAKSYQPKLFILGNPQMKLNILKHLDYPEIAHNSPDLFFEFKNMSEALKEIRKVMKQECEEEFLKNMMDFKLADDINVAKKNIFQITKAATEGKISRLLIADGINVFGKIDKKTGGLSINPCDQDHEDDDVLDDLAQIVISKGGEVVIAPRREIPKGRLALAILEKDIYELEDRKVASLWNPKMIQDQIS